MTDVRKVTRGVLTAGCATFAAALGMAVTPATSYADPAGHQVTYTITTTGNLTGNVRYMNTDPPSQAAFNANSSQFLNSVQTAFTAGQPLVIVEAMKMEHTVIAPLDGTVTELLVKAGQQVAMDETLGIVSPPAEPPGTAPPAR